VTLQPIETVTGKVLLDGVGLGAARVSVHVAAAENAVFLINGFPCRSNSSEVASTLTSADGMFSVSVREAGKYYLRAAARGCSDTDVGPIAIDPQRAGEVVTIALCKGGSINGSLTRLPPSLAGTPCFVGISRADGFATAQRADATGAFCFSGLAPGPWYVRRLDELIVPGITRSGSVSVSADYCIPITCYVVDGRTTELNLDMSGVCDVSGAMRTPAPLTDWNVAMTTPEAVGYAWRKTALGTDGSFRLLVDNPGLYRLRIYGRHDGVPGSFECMVAVKAGENVWAANVDMGELLGTGDASRDNVGGLKYSCEGPRLKFLASFSSRRLKERPIAVPAGVGRLTSDNGKISQNLVIQSGKQVIINVDQETERTK
jgi:hypothetical protein